jgi:hypothetical protein
MKMSHNPGHRRGADFADPVYSVVGAISDLNFLFRFSARVFFPGSDQSSDVSFENAIRSLDVVQKDFRIHLRQIL